MKILITLLLAILYCTLPVRAQNEEKPLSVGVFVYEGMEILDFAGPSEVFASTQGFKVFTVGIDADTITSQGFIKILPDYTIDNCPPTDILVYPGGSTGRLLDNEKLINWIKARDQNAKFTVSVCTGAALLSKAGLLDGKEATTWYGFIPSLQEMTPKAKIHSNTRFVDNGKIVTTAGVSAGIDGALHVVSRMKGLAYAQSTAKYMEYDKWKPQEGKIIPNNFIQKAENQGIEKAVKDRNAAEIVYEGDLVNLASDKIKMGKAKEAEQIIYFVLKEFKPSFIHYDILGDALRVQQKPAPISSQAFFKLLENGTSAEAEKAYQDYKNFKKAHPDWIFFTAEEIYGLGYRQNRAKKYDAAVKTWEIYAQEFDYSPWPHLGLAECYENLGQSGKALEHNKVCIEKTSKVNDQLSPGQRDFLQKQCEAREKRLNQ